MLGSLNIYYGIMFNGNMKCPGSGMFYMGTLVMLSA